MNETMTASEKADTGHPQPRPNVSITVNNEPVTIHRGHQTVSAIKSAAGVPQADDLVQDLDGKLVPLSDDGAVTLKGGEEFFSHPKSGGSSCS